MMISQSSIIYNLA